KSSALGGCECDDERRTRREVRNCAGCRLAVRRRSDPLRHCVADERRDRRRNTPRNPKKAGETVDAPHIVCISETHC
ncbi:hypothetical protein, partial [Burkholderia pseudomallei]|uniref:hypothetical protein n=1 Tax=Burkholderia pseudomallei TaxID=28450 RepID=UPI001C4CD0BC